MTLSLYILQGRLAVPTDSLVEWARAIEDRERVVALEEIGGYVISTMFLGVDHSFGRGLPILFETMIFGPGLFHESIGYQERCGTWEEAIDMHEKAVAYVISLLED